MTLHLQLQARGFHNFDPNLAAQMNEHSSTEIASSDRTLYHSYETSVHLEPLGFYHDPAHSPWLRTMTSSDVITLQNLEEKLPRWSPNSDSHLHAIVDMGSNGIRFSITSLEPPFTRLLRPLYSSRAAISLFDALTPSDAGLVFPDSVIASVASTLAGFTRQALSYGVPKKNIMVLATEAMRRAANGGRMLEAISKSTDGLGVHILDPAVETLCGAVLGSRSGLGSLPAQGALFLDLGGGSVQMTWVDPTEPSYEIRAAESGISLPFGAARLIKVLKQDDVAVCAEQVNKLSTGLAIAFDNLCDKFPRLQALRQTHQRGEGGLVDVFMCGGGFRGYGSMLMHTDEVQPYPFSTVNAYSVSAARFKDTGRMRRINEEQQGPIFGLSNRRREQFPAIITVIEALIDTVPNMGRVTFCGGSNREGAIMVRLPSSLRESNPLDALAGIDLAAEPVFSAVAEILEAALPREADCTDKFTIFSAGLTSLVLKESWSRQGYDADANTSFSLRHSIIRDTDTPGLSHSARALLALILAARWGGGLSPLDAQLSRNLQAVIDRESPFASFWAFYIGGILRIVAEVFPVLPQDAKQLRQTISLQSSIIRTQDKKDRLSSTITIHAGRPELNAEKMSKKLKETVRSAEQNSALKFESQVIIKS